MAMERFSKWLQSVSQEKVKVAFEKAIKQGDFAKFNALVVAHGMACLRSSPGSIYVMGATATALLAMLQNPAGDQKDKRKILDAILEADVLTADDKHTLFFRWFIEGKQWGVIKVDDDGGAAPEEKEDGSGKVDERACALTLFRHCSPGTRRIIFRRMVQNYEFNRAGIPVPPEFVCSLMHEAGEEVLCEEDVQSFLASAVKGKQWEVAIELFEMDWEKYQNRLESLLDEIQTTSEMVAFVRAMERHASTQLLVRVMLYMHTERFVMHIDEAVITSLVSLPQSQALGRENFEERLFNELKRFRGTLSDRAAIANRLSPHLEKFGEKEKGKPSFKTRVLEDFLTEFVRHDGFLDVPAIRVIMKDCSLLEPFSSPEIAREFFRLGLEKEFACASFANAEHAQANIQWLYRCAERIPNVDKMVDPNLSTLRAKILASAMVKNHDKPDVMVYLSGLNEAKTDDLSSELFTCLLERRAGPQGLVQIGDDLAPYVTKLDEKREGASLKMRLLEWSLALSEYEAEKTMGTLTNDCSLLGEFSSCQSAKEFFLRLCDERLMLTFFAFPNLRHTTTNIEWLLARLRQATTGTDEEYEHQKILMIIRAMVCNHRKVSIVEYLGSLLMSTKLEACADIFDQFVSTAGTIKSPEVLINIVRSLSPRVKDNFSRLMIEGAIRGSRCDIVITLLAEHRPLLEKAYLLHLLGEQPNAIPQEGSALVKELARRMDLVVQGAVDGNSFIQIFLLFKLGQGVLKNNAAIMQDLQKELRRVLAVDTVKFHLTGSWLKFIRTFFEIGKEGRYIGDGGQLEGEPAIDGKTVLEWVLIRLPSLAEELFLAGADTTGLENHRFVQSLIAEHSSFDRPAVLERDEKSGAVKATTVVGALLQVMPKMGGAAELVATYTQPALPVGDFGSQEKDIEASLGRLKNYIYQKKQAFAEEEKLDQKTQAALDEKGKIADVDKEVLALQESIASRAKAVQRWNLDERELFAIASGNSLRSILEKTESYLKAHKNDDMDSELKDILDELQGFTKHLRYGEVSQELQQDRDSAPRRGSSVEFFAQPVDMPDGGPAAVSDAVPPARSLTLEVGD